MKLNIAGLDSDKNNIPCDAAMPAHYPATCMNKLRFGKTCAGDFSIVSKH
jgi:hypothetical protein